MRFQFPDADSLLRRSGLATVVVPHVTTLHAGRVNRQGASIVAGNVIAESLLRPIGRARSSWTLCRTAAVLESRVVGVCDVARPDAMFSYDYHAGGNYLDTSYISN
jgi:hypothetical protein